MGSNPASRWCYSPGNTLLTPNAPHTSHHLTTSLGAVPSWFDSLPMSPSKTYPALRSSGHQLYSRNQYRRFPREMWGRPAGLPLDNGRARLTGKVSGRCSTDTRPHTVPGQPPQPSLESARRIKLALSPPPPTAKVNRATSSAASPHSLSISSNTSLTNSINHVTVMVVQHLPPAPSRRCKSNRIIQRTRQQRQLPQSHREGISVVIRYELFQATISCITEIPADAIGLTHVRQPLWIS